MIIAVICLSVLSCGRIKKKTTETMNKGGEAVGETATEFFEGVTEGVEKSLECEIELSDELKEAGLKTGKLTIGNDTAGGNNNKVTVYFIFDKAVNDTLSVKVSNKEGLELGRSTVIVNGAAGEAGYYDVVFDKRTYIEVKSKIEIQ